MPQRRSVRSAFPGRASDSAWRASAGRRSVLPRGRVGVCAQQPAGAAQGAAAVRVCKTFDAHVPIVTRTMKITLNIWRQAGPADKGRLVTYQAKDISPAMSFLEMLDVVNHALTLKGE